MILVGLPRKIEKYAQKYAQICGNMRNPEKKWNMRKICANMRKYAKHFSPPLLLTNPRFSVKKQSVIFKEKNQFTHNLHPPTSGVCRAQTAVVLFNAFKRTKRLLDAGLFAHPSPGKCAQSYVMAGPKLPTREALHLGKIIYKNVDFTIIVKNSNLKLKSWDPNASKFQLSLGSCTVRLPPLCDWLPVLLTAI
jgi:hypothetical protein